MRAAYLVCACVPNVVHVKIEFGQFLALLHKVSNGHSSFLFQTAQHAQHGDTKQSSVQKEIQLQQFLWSGSAPGAVQTLNNTASNYLQ